MDITAKHAAPDKDGVRIAELDEESFRYLLWDHKPLTDFWMTGPGTVKRLEKHGIYTMGELAYFSTVNQDCKCQYMNVQKVENKNVHFIRYSSFEFGSKSTFLKVLSYL